MGASAARRTRFRSLRASNFLSCRSLAHWHSCRITPPDSTSRTNRRSIRACVPRSSDSMASNRPQCWTTRRTSRISPQWAAFSRCAEAVGAAAAVLDLAREYAAQRRQFGHTIASFQALRHLLADMHVQVESFWSSVLYAAASLDEARARRVADRVDREGVHARAQRGRSPTAHFRFSEGSPSPRSILRTATCGGSSFEAGSSAPPPTMSGRSDENLATRLKVPA